VDGYFVHFFAPKGLTKGNKNILFILDVSGSMSGTKIRQVKESMKTILNDLGAGDLFNIMLFSSNPNMWRSDMQPVNSQTKQDALSFTNRMKADGGKRPSINFSLNINVLRQGGVEGLLVKS
jgi:secreted protein with Ig-like and vWFA domain